MAKREQRIKQAIKITALSLAIISMVSCAKNKEETKDKPSRFGGTIEISNKAVHMDREDLFINDTGYNPNIEPIEQPGATESVSDNSTQEEPPADKAYNTTAELTELIMHGEDNTEYYEIQGNDVIYNGVVYKELASTLNTLPHPYSTQSLINFIVKTYKPKSNTVRLLVTVEENGKIPEGYVVGLDDGLKYGWDGYSAIAEKYGTPVTWQIIVCDYDTYDRQATLYGNGDYIIYLGAYRGVEIDMEAVSAIKPEQQQEIAGETATVQTEAIEQETIQTEAVIQSEQEQVQGQEPVQSEQIEPVEQVEPAEQMQ